LLNDYYYDGDKWTDLNDNSAAMQRLRDALENKFGEDWVDKYADGKDAATIMANIDKRLGSEQFWETFFDGSPDILYQTIEERINAESDYTEFYRDWLEEQDWLQTQFWNPEEWEIAMCENWFNVDVDYPETVQVGYNEYGSVLFCFGHSCILFIRYVSLVLSDPE